MTDRLPKSWCVKNDGSQRFKDIVIRYVNSVDEYYNNFDGDAEGYYYGRSNRTHIGCYMNDKMFDTVLTIDEFIELTTEESPNWKELYS